MALQPRVEARVPLRHVLCCVVDTLGRVLPCSVCMDRTASSCVKPYLVQVEQKLAGLFFRDGVHGAQAVEGDEPVCDESMSVWGRGEM